MADVTVIKLFAGRKQLILLYSTLEADNIQYLFYFLLLWYIIIIFLEYCMVSFLFLILI